MKEIKTIKIHPAIGVARIGNSPSGYFIGPEFPGYYNPPPGGYKDKQMRIKRQAARFRIFGFDANNNVVKEITASDAEIKWTVHLANKKAAWKRFDGLKKNSLLRNQKVLNRADLIIDPGPRTVSGCNNSFPFNTGLFMGTNVPLGEIRTDYYGRLLVLGGFGNSDFSSGKVKHLEDFANNDGWYDDVSDGPVNAIVTLKSNGKTINAVGAWVICPPPDFAPPITSIITLYDTLFQLAVDRGLKEPCPKPSFRNDIYPLLQRAINMKWVNKLKMDHEHTHEINEHTHEINEHAHEINEHDHDSMKGHMDGSWANIIPPPGSAAARAFIFGKLRDPSLPHNIASKDDSDMPMLYNDYNHSDNNQPLTRIQYEYLRKWKNGNFINDWNQKQKPSLHITPEGLDRAALEGCVGASFYPGIEAGWMLRDVFEFIEPFRLDNSKREPGDITKQMAIPWQADFSECAQGDGHLAWWPSQRPDAVFPISGGKQISWTRYLIYSKDPKKSRMNMVRNWYRLGFVVKKGSKFIETESSVKKHIPH